MELEVPNDEEHHEDDASVESYEVREVVMKVYCYHAVYHPLPCTGATTQI